VSIELALRLLASGSISRTQVRAALVAHTTQAIPLIKALQNHGASCTTIEQQAHLANVPHLEQVSPLIDTIAQLPKRMCAQLLAVPVRIDPTTHTVDVAMADPFDLHAQQELAHHLEAPVRVVVAPPAAIDHALDGIEARASGRPPRLRTPSFGVPSVRPAPGSISLRSEVPIPLVRRSRPTSESSHADDPDATPQTLECPPAAGPPEDGPPDSIDDPTVASLRVAIPTNGPVPDIRGATNTRTMPSDFARRLDAALDDLSHAMSRDRIVVAAVRGMSNVAGRVGVFAVRRDVFAGWASSLAGPADDAFKAIRIPRDRDSVLDRAASDGWFFGLIPRDAIHRPLHTFLPRADREATIVAVRIRGRAAMLIIGAQLFDTLIASRAAERIANASAAALVRVLRAEKREAGLP